MKRRRAKRSKAWAGAKAKQGLCSEWIVPLTVQRDKAVEAHLPVITFLRFGFMSSEYLNTYPRPAAIVLVMLVMLGLFVHGVPARASLVCKLYQWRTQEVHYQTTYRYSTDDTDVASKRYETLPEKGVYAIARLYEVTPETQQIKPCRNLSIVKRLFLQRKDDPDFVFKEINEFYTADGALIVTNTQNLTDQLAQTGYYVASDALPIPQDAPPGRYQMVSKLVLTKKGRKASFLLASANTEYEILPLEQNVSRDS